ncbi:MAG TPA: hypothetical protein VFR18_12185 [Terriglobia bacterium]|nr:hypothetical protein [Terriglobia bacterium]
MERLKETLHRELSASFSTNDPLSVTPAEMFRIEEEVRKRLETIPTRLAVLGDLDGDGMVGCADLSIVRGSSANELRRLDSMAEQI